MVQYVRHPRPQLLARDGQRDGAAHHDGGDGARVNKVAQPAERPRAEHGVEAGLEAHGQSQDVPAETHHHGHQCVDCPRVQT